jgi:hypothetical protein
VDGRTDMMELRSAFRECENRLKKGYTVFEVDRTYTTAEMRVRIYEI